MFEAQPPVATMVAFFEDVKPRDPARVVTFIGRLRKKRLGPNNSLKCWMAIGVNFGDTIGTYELRWVCALSNDVVIVDQKESVDCAPGRTEGDFVGVLDMTGLHPGPLRLHVIFDGVEIGRTSLLLLPHESGPTARHPETSKPEGN